MGECRNVPELLSGGAWPSADADPLVLVAEAWHPLAVCKTAPSRPSSWTNDEGGALSATSYCRQSTEPRRNVSVLIMIA